MKMVDKIVRTIIVGAGIAGLSCARKLQEEGKDFLLISKNIGGRILTSEDGTANYGAFFVCSDFYHILKFVKIRSRIRLRDFCFHENNYTFILLEPNLIRYTSQFLKISFFLYKFRQALHRFRKMSELSSQKKAIEHDPLLYRLYLQNATDFVRTQNLQHGTDKYFSKALYSTTFSSIHEINAFFYLQYLMPLITPVYTFTFELEKLVTPFKEKIMTSHVDAIRYKNDQYRIRANGEIYSSNNLILATEITTTQKLVGIKTINKPVKTNMLHIRGIPRNTISRKTYQLFASPSNIQAIARLEDGTYLLYYKHEEPSLTRYFRDPSIIAHKYWNPAGTINGHVLIESKRGRNMFLAGDFNVVGLEDAYITGLYAANQIIDSNL